MIEKSYGILTEEFVLHEKIRGIRSLRKIPYELKAFFTYLEKDGLYMDEVTIKNAQDFQTYLATLKDSNGELHYLSSGVSSIIFTTKSFYVFLYKRGYVLSNSFDGIKTIKLRERVPEGIPVEKKMNEMLEDLRCFWNKKHLRERRNIYRIHVLAELLYATGLRLNEAASLKIEDIDTEKNLVHVRDGKGGKDRTAYMGEYASRILRYYIDEMRELVIYRDKNNKLFGIATGRNLDPFANRHLKKTGKEHGLNNFTTHKFRHTLGYHLLRRGCDMRYIQLILGHDSINSTMIYTKVAKDDLKKALDTYHPRKFRSKEKI